MNGCKEAQKMWKSFALLRCGILGVVCVLVIGLYAYAARSGPVELLSLNPADTYYNLLVQGFRAGQLSVKREAPPGLVRLANPYDPNANTLYRSDSYGMLDMSYYKGRLYLYFGITPVLILFWPFTALTGHYLFHRQAVVIFCAIGFLASVGLLRALWQRYFAEVSVWVVAACGLALGLATGVPILLSRSDVHEVPISCGHMLTMLALWAILRALHGTERRCWWLAVASMAYGLAVGARPSLLIGAVILLVPVIKARRERRPIWVLLMAAICPIMFIGLGLMLYNYLRFDNPFEFGWRYQLSPIWQDSGQHFSLRYFWFNLRIYFLGMAHWSGRFPFMQYDISAPAVPLGHHGNMEKAFGVLLNIPLVWLALAVPLVWRRRSADAHSILRWFLAAMTLLFVICALTIGGFFCAERRYEVEFLPSLVLLAVIGILGLERAFAPALESGQVGRSVWRCAARWVWGLLLGLSVAFNLFACVENYAMANCYIGNALSSAGKVQEAIRHYEQALRIKPDLADAHCNLGTALGRVDKLEDAIGHYERALQIKPDYALAHNNLGVALWQAGKSQEAVEHYEQALRFKPDFAEAHYNLGVASERAGKVQEAIRHYEQALRFKPDYAETQNKLVRLRAVQ